MRRLIKPQLVSFTKCTLQQQNFKAKCLMNVWSLNNFTILLLQTFHQFQHLRREKKYSTRSLRITRNGRHGIEYALLLQVFDSTNVKIHCHSATLQHTRNSNFIKTAAANLEMCALKNLMRLGISCNMVTSAPNTMFCNSVSAMSYRQTRSPEASRGLVRLN